MRVLEGIESRWSSRTEAKAVLFRRMRLREGRGTKKGKVAVGTANKEKKTDSQREVNPGNTKKGNRRSLEPRDAPLQGQRLGRRLHLGMNAKRRSKGPQGGGGRGEEAAERQKGCHIARKRWPTANKKVGQEKDRKSSSAEKEKRGRWKGNLPDPKGGRAVGHLGGKLANSLGGFERKETVKKFGGGGHFVKRGRRGRNPSAGGWGAVDEVVSPVVDIALTLEGISFFQECEGLRKSTEGGNWEGKMGEGRERPKEGP